MSDIKAEHVAVHDTSGRQNWLQWIAVAALVYLLICAVGMIGSGFKAATGDQAKELFALANNPFAGLAVGTVATALIQSSSAVTSIIVGPVAGGLPVEVAVPMVMGANIGTCITTMLAATVVTGNEEAALQIAFIHLSYNVLGVVVIYGIPLLRDLPVRAAEWLGATAAVNKLAALAYILGVFFVVPGVCLGITSMI